MHFFSFEFFFINKKEKLLFLYFLNTFLFVEYVGVSNSFDNKNIGKKLHV